MKIKHSTDIEIPASAEAIDFKRALEDIPDTASVKIVVHVTEADRPWESRQTRTTLHAEWDVDRS